MAVLDPGGHLIAFQRADGGSLMRFQIAAGKAAGGNINLSVSGPISGSLHVTYGGSSQKVAISTTGSELAGISLNLSR